MVNHRENSESRVYLLQDSKKVERDLRARWLEMRRCRQISNCAFGEVDPPLAIKGGTRPPGALAGDAALPPDLKLRLRRGLAAPSEKSIHRVQSSSNALTAQRYQEIAAREVLPWRETYLWVRKLIAATGPMKGGFREKWRSSLVREPV
jgi:hypothetical protein